MELVYRKGKRKLGMKKGHHGKKRRVRKEGKMWVQSIHIGMHEILKQVYISIF